MDKLQQKGLDLKTSGNSQTTIEEVQRLLRSIGENETASNLKNLIDFGKHLTLENVTCTLKEKCNKGENL